MAAVQLEGNYDATQVQLMNEKCILVDEKDQQVGFESKKNCHLNEQIEKGLLHRAFSVFLFNTKGQLLLQQRADEKITFPQYWTNTVCSHPLYFETEDGKAAAEQPEMEEADRIGVKKAAIRKLEHELGVTADQVPIEEFNFLTRILYKAKSCDVWGEHEIDYILFIQKDVTVNPNPNEAKAIKYVSKEELKEFLATAKENNVPITPWFALIVEKFLYGWWDKLDNLDAVKEDDTIHIMT